MNKNRIKLLLEKDKIKNGIKEFNISFLFFKFYIKLNSLLSLIYKIQSFKIKFINLFHRNMYNIRVNLNKDMKMYLCMYQILNSF